MKRTSKKRWTGLLYDHISSQILCLNIRAAHFFTGDVNFSPNLDATACNSLNSQYKLPVCGAVDRTCARAMCFYECWKFAFTAKCVSLVALKDG